MNITFMQAKLAFKAMSLSSTISASLKFVFGFIFVIVLEQGVGGALVAYLIFIFTPIIISVIVLRKVLFLKSEKSVHISSKSLVAFGIPSAIVAFCLSSFISTDIILVKHLFNAQQAGLYAGLSLIGKIIYFIVAPVMTVMFPLVTKRFNKNENHKNLLYLSIFLVAFASLAIIFFYFIFPEFTILFFLKRTEYLSVARLLPLFGIFISIYSIVSLLAYYFLSIKKTIIYIPLLIGTILQVILILAFHETFLSVIYDSLISVVAVLVVLLYYLKVIKS
jgi:O-antigen/teichoic acid export membrane protein